MPRRSAWFSWEKERVCRSRGLAGQVEYTGRRRHSLHLLRGRLSFFSPRRSALPSRLRPVFSRVLWEIRHRRCEAMLGLRVLYTGDLLLVRVAEIGG